MIQKPRKILNKKGVSPLIATVLLISFAVALGSVVLSWGITRLPGDKCDSIKLEVIKVNDVEACYSGSGQNVSIYLTITNKGSVDIDGLEILVFGSKETNSISYDSQIKKGQTIATNGKNILYDSSKSGIIQKIWLFPKVRTEETVETCKTSIEINEVRPCSNKL
jgi:flagellin-like protein